MKASTFVGLMGAGAILGLIGYAAVGADKRQADAEFYGQCHRVGTEVPAACVAAFPEIPVCKAEDCSDIKEHAGYWIDPDDGRVWLTLRPQMRDAPQRSA